MKKELFWNLKIGDTFYLNRLHYIKIGNDRASRWPNDNGRTIPVMGRQVVHVKEVEKS